MKLRKEQFPTTVYGRVKKALQTLTLPLLLREMRAGKKVRVVDLDEM